MKKYLIEATVQGSKRMFVKTEQELYSSLNWKDNRLRWGSGLVHDVVMNDVYFKSNITGLRKLLLEFEEITEVTVF